MIKKKKKEEILNLTARDFGALFVCLLTGKKITEKQADEVEVKVIEYLSSFEKDLKVH